MKLDVFCQSTIFKYLPVGATQHRVATDAPVGAFKIRPILVKACAIYPVPRLQGRG